MRWNLFFIIIIGLCTFSFAQDTPAQKSDATVQSTQALYTCPMHPDVKMDKPGECPKCGMDLIAMNDQTKGGMAMDAKSDSIAKAKKRAEMKAFMQKKFALIKEGRYRCCIDGACDHCVAEGGCNCREAAENGTPVCEECYKGWVNGDGMVPGKTLKDIKHEGHETKDKK